MRQKDNPGNSPLCCPQVPRERSRDANTMMMQMLELSDKNVKSDIIKNASVNKYSTDILETNFLKSLSKETDEIKKNQMEVLELKK